MVWEYYSLGDSSFLYQVINGAAMIFNDASFGGLIAIGALLGVIVLCFQGLANGGQFPQFQQILIGFIIYSCAFVPKTTIRINDVYDQSVRMVDNVPLVFAASSLISQVGNFVSSKFEQAFSTPGMTSYGFVDPLTVLSKVRGEAMNTLGIADASRTGNYDILDSWKNYVQDCTLMGVDRGDLDPNEIYKSDDFLKAIKYEHYGLTTEIYDSQKQPKLLSCADAWIKLESDTKGAFTKKLDENLINKLAGLVNIETARETTESRIARSLQALNIASSNASKFMIVSALQPIYFLGAQEKYVRYQQPEYAAMMNDALTRRDTLNAAEATVFMTIVRPLMAFMEAFVFAVTPFMAFLVVSGTKGVSLAGKYFTLLIWIQLWNPLLSIVNLYIINTAANNVAGFVSASANGISMANLDDMGATISHWIGVGGMMASSVPALALMLMYGSAVTATSLMSKMQSGGNIDPSIATPSTVSNPAALTTGNNYNANMAHGAALQYMPQGMPHFSGQTAFQNQASILKGQSAEHGVNFASQLGRGFIDTFSARAGASTGGSLATTFRGEGNKHMAAEVQKMEGYSRDAGFSDAQSEKIAAATTLAAHAGISVDSGKFIPFIRAKAGLDTGTSNSKEAAALQTKLTSYKNNLSTGYAEKGGYRASIGNSAAKDISAQKDHAWAKDKNGKIDSGITQAATNTAKVSEAYNIAKTRSGSFTSGTNTDLQVSSAAVAHEKNPEANEALQEAITGGGAEYQNAQQKMEERWGANLSGMEENQKKAALGLLTLNHLMNHGNKEISAQAAGQLTDVLEKSGIVPTSAANAPQAVQDGEQNGENIENKVDQQSGEIKKEVAEGDSELTALQAKVDQQLGSSLQKLHEGQKTETGKDGDTTVKQTSREAEADVNTEANKNQAELDQRNRKEASNDLKRAILTTEVNSGSGGVNRLGTLSDNGTNILSKKAQDSIFGYTENGYAGLSGAMAGGENHIFAKNADYQDARNAGRETGAAGYTHMQAMLYADMRGATTTGAEYFEQKDGVTTLSEKGQRMANLLAQESQTSKDNATGMVFEIYGAAQTGHVNDAQGTLKYNTANDSEGKSASFQQYVQGVMGQEYDVSPANRHGDDIDAAKGTYVQDMTEAKKQAEQHQPNKQRPYQRGSRGKAFGFEKQNNHGPEIPTDPNQADPHAAAMNERASWIASTPHRKDIEETPFIKPQDEIRT